MNDVAEAAGELRNVVVRPRDAASLILLRGEGKDLEVLAGRRPPHVRFMPGVHVFPGGAIDPPDRVAWNLETGIETLGPKLAGKVHVWMGTIDTFRLEGATILMKQELEELGSDADILLVEGRDHMTLGSRHPELWPDGMLARIHREMFASYEKHSAATAPR